MLVLSRRQGQRVHFPTLGISVEVVQIKGQAIRLGIQAPPDIPVLREELLGTEPNAIQIASRRESNHDLRNTVNTAVIGLFLAEKQLQAGMIAEAELTLQESLRVLEAIDQSLAVKGERTESKPRQKVDTLIVEDDRNQEALLAGYLRMSGFQVEAVHDGIEALDYLSSHAHPSFVLLDMGLPRCDGLSTVSAIRQNPGYDDVRIFAVTGCSPEQLGITTKPAGVDAWFRKPLNPAELVEAMTIKGSRT